MRSDNSGRRERTRPGILVCVFVRQSSVRGCRFSFVFVYFVIKCVDCSLVPASFFPYLLTSLHWFPYLLTEQMCGSCRESCTMQKSSEHATCLGHAHTETTCSPRRNVRSEYESHSSPLADGLLRS